MEKINDWITSFRLRKIVRLRNLYKELEELCSEEFDLLYINNKTKLTKRKFLRGVSLFFVLLFLFLMIAVYFYGMSVLLKNEIHATLSAKDIEIYNVVINVWISVFFMFCALSFVLLCSVIRDIRKIETEVLAMELVYKRRSYFIEEI
ncbi:hypothetical protein LF864_12875 [Enterococcus faecalis]|jgi:magnesium-transporting ATPase (P-type)|uniref:hypothetical protein n=1 Tax=Enterococcus faecalis TaxID=1351 RepID=UPI001CF5FD1E|nr:hypothetical protein [Enterococcus faecalis]EJG4482807.1 hypothetical protein [Enterococcus faecalis]MCA6712094.1 hypothetical protein [Enterococcus faecalis]MCA6725596.1 hypothetical protein [Enterococcus faecalis]MCA6731144.1 hypothetical protein [Enterococcus faecalis]MCA6751837.1 hypothetical protein [Enterococcus faecalis]